MKKETVNKFLRRFGVELHGLGFIQSIKKSDFQENAFDVQQKLMLNVPKVIFDIGANRGNTVIKYAKLFPTAKIYAFEPFLETFEILKDNVKDISNINISNFAIAEKIGETVFYSNKNEDTNSILSSSKIGLSSDEQVKTIGQTIVNTETIDSFCSTHKIDKIDILKMDIQGAELLALIGAIKLLEEKKIGLIYTETYFRRQYNNQPLFHEISKFLADYGYYIQDIYSPIYGKGSIAWCDAIFLPE
jgi:FkbM family methyltransferase